MKSLINILFITFFLKMVLIKANDDDDDDENDTNDNNTTKEDKLDPEIFRKITGLRIRSPREIQTVMSLIDLPLLMFHYRTESKASIEAAHYLYEAFQKLEHIVSVLLIDCDNFDETYEKCKRNEYSDGFPKVSLMATPERRFDIFTKELYTHREVPWPGSEFTETNIYNFAIQDYVNKAIKLTSSNLKLFMK